MTTQRPPAASSELGLLELGSISKTFMSRVGMRRVPVSAVHNVTMTVAMVLTTAISLGLLGGGLLVVRTIDRMEEQYYDRVETVVFLSEDVSANDADCASGPCTDLRGELEATSGVETVVFESRAQAFA